MMSRTSGCFWFARGRETCKSGLSIRSLWSCIDGGAFIPQFQDRLGREGLVAKVWARRFGMARLTSAVAAVAPVSLAMLVLWGIGSVAQTAATVKVASAAIASDVGFFLAQKKG